VQVGQRLRVTCGPEDWQSKTQQGLGDRCINAPLHLLALFLLDPKLPGLPCRLDAGKGGFPLGTVLIAHLVDDELALVKLAADWFRAERERLLL
jgi:hypothetical protein